ncbi:MAG: Rieske 2Fe-2S domain-containing protein [Acidimicrobiales bacterium]
MGIYELAARLGTVEALDRIAEPLLGAARKLVPPGVVKDAMSGTWLGHPLHPLLTDVVIGSFTSASVLDVVGGRRGQPAANTLTALGIASAVPTAAAGLSDWSESSRAERRVGVVHASANIVGLGFYTASLVARSRGRRGRAASLGLLGMGVMTVGGYLGGHLSFSNGVGVNHTFWQHGPDDWTPVLAESELPEGTPASVDAGDASVLLYRGRDGIRAIASRCSHAGGPLEEGEIDSAGLCVTCPWHQSVFRLDDGHVVHGPATAPQPTFAVRVEGGKIEVRAR